MLGFCRYGACFLYAYGVGLSLNINSRKGQRHKSTDKQAPRRQTAQGKPNTAGIQTTFTKKTTSAQRKTP
jgi:hypothetical protein